MTEPVASAFINNDPVLMAFDAVPNKLLHQAQVTLLLKELMEQIRKPSSALLDQMAVAA